MAGIIIFDTPSHQVKRIPQAGKKGEVVDKAETKTDLSKKK